MGKRRKKKILSTHKIGLRTSTPFSVTSPQETAAPGTSKFTHVHSWLILVERRRNSLFVTFRVTFFLPFPVTCLVMDENHVGVNHWVYTWDRTEAQLYFGHWIFIAMVEVYQKWVIIHTKLFDCCSVDKVAEVSMAEFTDTLYKGKRGDKSPFDHGFAAISWLDHVWQKAFLKFFGESWFFSKFVWGKSGMSGNAGIKLRFCVTSAQSYIMAVLAAHWKSWNHFLGIDHLNFPET